MMQCTFNVILAIREEEWMHQESTMIIYLDPTVNVIKHEGITLGVITMAIVLCHNQNIYVRCLHTR